MRSGILEKTYRVILRGSEAAVDAVALYEYHESLVLPLGLHASAASSLKKKKSHNPQGIAWKLTRDLTAGFEISL